MREAYELKQEEAPDDEIETHLASLEDISEDLEDILFSMQDLAEKIDLYQETHQIKGDLQSILKKITEFCSRQDEFSGILGGYS